MRLRFVAAAAGALLLAACSDTTSPEAKGPSANRRIIAPSGTLDQNITALLNLLPNGNATAAKNRWGNVKAKYAEGLSKPQQAKVAQKMLFELVEWLQDKTPTMSAPPNGETVNAASARLVLYMSLYIHEGPGTQPPEFTPEADNTVALVSPDEEATVVTPEEQAGVALEAGAVDEETIIVITQNPTPYPENCSGPLQTKVCQYPLFYHFNQFPHERLQKAAKFAVCHINEGTERRPLADHDRFRLAHTLPASSADYTPGSTIRDQNGEAIEILPLIHQEFAPCEDIHYALNPPTGFKGALALLAKNVGKLITPKNAYAIDQGGGGESFMFSEFNNVDPEGVPNDSVEALTTSADSTHPNDHVTLTYRVKNNGTATSNSPAVIAFHSGIEAPTTMILTSVPVADLAPGEVRTISTEVVVPGSAMPGGGHSFSVNFPSDPAIPDANPADNAQSVPVSVQPMFLSMSRRWNTGESATCALTASNATYCWGNNGFREFGAAGPHSSVPFQSTPLQLNFVEMARGPASQFFCGIKADRSAVCWGRNGFGQLGNGTAFPSPAGPAVVIGGISWNEITTNRLSACGVSNTGVGYCWGSNQRGEIGRASVPMGGSGDPATLTLSPAVLDGGLTWRSVVAGWLHACGITTSGDAYCWGDNSRGQLGIGVIDNDPTHRSPAPVVGGHKFVQLSLGATHTCGITPDHRAYCWGENFTGQLGVGATGADIGAPTLVAGGMRFSYIAAGSDFAVGGGVPAPVGSGQAGAGHTCALSEQGEAWCWGWNPAGQLGNGTTVDSNVPVKVSGSFRFTSLSLGGTTSCGRLSNVLWCWGGNEFGQLGIGTLTNMLTPALVGFPFGGAPPIGYRAVATRRLKRGLSCRSRHQGLTLVAKPCRWVGLAVR